MRNEPISDETLGAYVDDELDAASVVQLDGRLAADAALQARVAALQRVTNLVRAATGPASAEPRSSVNARGTGPRADATGQARHAPRIRKLSGPLAWGIAASLVAALAGALLSSLLIGRDAGGDGWQQHALVFHESYLAALDARRIPLLDARASDPATLGQSLAALVDNELVVVPDLSEHGYAPQGARLIETAAGPVAYVVYAGANKPLLGLSVLRSSPGDDGEEHLHQHGELKLLEWSDGEHRFGVSGAHSAESLRTLADAVQDFAAGSADEPSI